MAPVQAYDSFMPVVIVLCLLVARHGAALMLPHVPGRRVSRRSTRGTCITETYMYAPRSGQSLAETLIRKDGAKVDVSGRGTSVVAMCSGLDLTLYLRRPGLDSST